MIPLDDPRFHGHVLNAGGGRRVSVHELAEMVIGEVGAIVEPEISGLYNRAGDTRYIESDLSDTLTFGWGPFVQQAAMVERYVSWARTQPDLCDTASEAIGRMKLPGVLKAAEQ